MNTQVDVTTNPAPISTDPNAVPDPALVAPTDGTTEPDAPAPSAPVVEPAPALTAEDVTLPEGFIAEGEVMEEFLTFANDLGLDKDKASALVGLHAKVLESAQTAAATEWQKLQDTWIAEAKALPQIGGDKLDESLSVIAKAIDKYGSPEAKEAFTITGAGNNPHIIKLLHSMASKLVEAPPVSGNPTNAGPQDRASRMFKT